MVRLRSLVALILIPIALASLPEIAESALPGWNPVADGIEYRLFELPGPNRVHVARMDRHNPRLILESSLAQGRLARGLETVRGMAERYDRAINAWGGAWGTRNRVVVAINGSFHDQSTGVPESGQIQSGWYLKRFDNGGGGSGFAWTLEREAFIGSCVQHPAESQLVRYHRTGRVQNLDGINTARGRNKLVLYTPQFDAHTRTSDGGVEVLVQLTQPMHVLPPPLMLRGFVTQIRDGQGSTPIPFDHIVLSATGDKRAKLLQSAGLGDEIGISMEIEHFQSDCETPSLLDWSRTYASVSGSFPFLRNRRIQTFYHDRGATNRHPRTAICFNAAYLYFVVVDGRNPERSIGMTIDELAAFCRNELGATFGINQDGGGSSTMWINGEVVNEPWKGTERRVANGMMMVVVEPLERSGSLRPWQRVVSTAPTEVRLGPGSNYAALDRLSEGTRGVVLPHRNGINGVLAKGEYWWRVALGNVYGWAPESALISVEAWLAQEQTAPPAE